MFKCAVLIFYMQLNVKPLPNKFTQCCFSLYFTVTTILALAIWRLILLFFPNVIGLNASDESLGGDCVMPKQFIHHFTASIEGYSQWFTGHQTHWD